MSVTVVVDGGVSLPEGGLARHCTIVPMQLGDVPADDGSGRSEARTAAASPGAFLEAIEAADEGDGVVVVTVAAGLSASYASARAACGLAGREVALVDSGSATTGEGLVALAAAEAAAAGGSVAQVAAAARRAAGEVRLAAQIERLDELARGGRLPKGVAVATRRVGVRVLFEVRDGRIRPLRPAIGLPGAEARLVELVARTLRPGSRLHLGALHAGAADSARRIVRAVSARGTPSSCFVAELSPLMRVHTGSGVSGLAWRVENGGTGT